MVVLIVVGLVRAHLQKCESVGLQVVSAVLNETQSDIDKASKNGNGAENERATTTSIIVQFFFVIQFLVT